MSDKPYEDQADEIMNGVTLSIQAKREIVNPSANQIKEAIQSSTSGDDPFVILARSADSLTYVQTLFEENRWVVEYQDGHIERHFLASEDLGTDAVIGLFLAFAKEEKTWRASVRWEPLRL